MADDQAAALFDGTAPAASAGPSSSLTTSPSSAPTVGVSPANTGAQETEDDASKAEPPPAAGKAGTGRKRVFTFQKRWLHSLPIMERSLPESAVGGTPMKPRINDAAAMNAAGSSQPSPTGEGKDVVVCMLCDDPASKRDAPKIWSRLNCRRGRIENHLWSKHPEFMMLLKQKHEAEGDLAVQIFLQSMRDGRCNVRNEIGAGLYAHLHSSTNGGAGGKRSIEQLQGDVHDQSAAQKRAKIDSGKDAAAPGGMYSAGMSAIYTSGGLLRQTGQRDGDVDSGRVAAAYDVPQPLPTYNEAPTLTALSSWSISLLNKVVVMTGGDNEVMMNAAAQLWSLGANVLITFSDRSMLDTFMSTSLARCPETHEHLGIPRGAMLPLLCNFTTHKQLDDWSRSIAARFPRVHCLINYAHVADDQAEPSPGPNGNSNGDETAAPGATEPINAAGHKESLGSTMDRLRSISDVVTMHCVPPAVPGTDGSCTVINVTSQVAASGDAVRAWAQSVAQDARPKLVHANFVEMSGIKSSETVTGGAAKSSGDDSSQDQSRQQNAAATTSLLHTVALLCSPAGRLISGSVLRIESEDSTPADATSDGATTASEGGSSAGATPVNGTEAAAVASGDTHALGTGADGATADANDVHVV